MNQLHDYQQKGIDDVGKGQWTIYLGIPSNNGIFTLEGFYSGREIDKLHLPTVTDNQSKAKRFKTIRGAKQSLRLIKKDINIAHSLITNRFFSDLTNDKKSILFIMSTQGKVSYKQSLGRLDRRIK